MWILDQLFVKRMGSYLNVKKSIVLMISVVIFSTISGFSPHPYHVSYTEINFEKDSRSLTFVMEIFTDDLENAIKLEYKPKKFFLGNDSLTDSANIFIERYISERVTIIIDGIVLKDLQFLPTESNPDRTTIYFELTSLPNFKSFAFYNEILTNTFLDQQNIVEFKYDDKREKALFTKEKTSATWILK
jgi:hypothetical protein